MTDLPARRGIKRAAISINSTSRNAAQWRTSAQAARARLDAILAEDADALARRSAEIEAQASKIALEGADRTAFIRKSMDAARRENLVELREKLDVFTKEQLAPLQIVKEKAPDKRSMLAVRGARDSAGMNAALAAVSKMRAAELDDFAGLMLAEIEETQAVASERYIGGEKVPADITNEQCAYVFAIGQRAMALPRDEQPFTSAQLADAVAVPVFDKAITDLAEAKKGLMQVEREAFDLYRNGKVTALSKMHGVADKLHALKPQGVEDPSDQTPDSSVDKIRRGLGGL